MAYYRGKRYVRKPAPKARVKRTMRRIAERAWQSVQGGHLDGHKDPEHYIAQSVRSSMSREERELDKALAVELANREDQTKAAREAEQPEPERAKEDPGTKLMY